MQIFKTFFLILLNVNLSFNQDSPDILALCETNLDGSIDSGNFSVRGYLPLIWKDSVTHMHGVTVYVKEGLPFAHNLPLENSADSYLCFWLALLHSVRVLARNEKTVFCMNWEIKQGVQVLCQPLNGCSGQNPWKNVINNSKLKLKQKIK